MSDDNQPPRDENGRFIPADERDGAGEDENTNDSTSDQDQDMDRDNQRRVEVEVPELGDDDDGTFRAQAAHGVTPRTIYKMFRPGEHYTAGDFYTALQESGHDVPKRTVYDYLKRLRREGWIVLIEHGGSTKTWQLPEDAAESERESEQGSSDTDTDATTPAPSEAD